MTFLIPGAILAGTGFALLTEPRLDVFFRLIGWVSTFSGGLMVGAYVMGAQ